MYDRAGQQHSLERERPLRNCAVDLVLKYVNSPEGQRDEFTQTGDRACTESSGKGAQESTQGGNKVKVYPSLVVRKETRQVD